MVPWQVSSHAVLEGFPRCLNPSLSPRSFVYSSLPRASSGSQPDSSAKAFRKLPASGGDALLRGTQHVQTVPPSGSGSAAPNTNWRISSTGSESTTPQQARIEGQVVGQNSRAGASSGSLERLLALGYTPDYTLVAEILAPQAQHWKRNPKVVTFFLERLVRRPCVVQQVLTFMKASRVESNVFHYSKAIEAYERDGQWQLALSLFSSMLESTVIPNEFTYSAAMSACHSGGQWELALSLLRHMPETQLIPDVVCINAGIRACGQGGQWQLALGLLHTMPEMSMKPSSVSYNAAMIACEQGGQLHLALSLVGSMQGLSLASEGAMYTSSFSSCMEDGNWQLAMDMLTKMDKDGVSKTKLAYFVAIGACGKGGQWQRALGLLREMPEVALQADQCVYNLAFDAMYEVPIGPELFREAFQQDLYPNLLRLGYESLDLHGTAPGAAALAVRWWLAEILGSV